MRSADLSLRDFSDNSRRAQKPKNEELSGDFPEPVKKVGPSPKKFYWGIDLSARDRDNSDTAVRRLCIVSMFIRWRKS